MELRVLRYFLAIVEEKNISNASKRLHVSQPTISRQIKELEDELGVTLFDRGSRKIELTDNGEYFANQARQLLSLADKTVENIHTTSDVRGSISIGSAEAKSFMNVAHSIYNLKQHSPNIDINIVSTNADETRVKLKSGAFDFGVIMDTADKNDYEFISLPGKSRWGLLVPNSSELAKKDTLALNDLIGPKLLISHQSGMATTLQEWFGTSTNEFNIAATYNLSYNASLMVAAGIGYALCIDGIINTNQSELTFVPLDPAIMAGTNLVWMKNYHLSTAAQAFLNQISKDLQI